MTLSPTPTPTPTPRPTLHPEALRGETPLHRAVRTGTVEDVKKALARGANVNATSYVGNTPLHFAAWLNPDAAIGALLLDEGADVNANATRGRFDSGWTSLHFAARQPDPSFAELLLDRGGDVNARTVRGYTPLHYAATRDRAATAELLLDRGADVHATANILLGAEVDNWTPLHQAALTGRRELVALLLEWGADVQAEARRRPSEVSGGPRVSTPLGIAVIHTDDPGVVEILLDHGAVVAKGEWPEGVTGLHFALSPNKLGVAQVFLDRGADIEARDGKGRTPLHYAHTMEALLFLLDRGADWRATDYRGYTLLHSADSAEMAVKLLDLGLDVNATAGDDDHTALHGFVLQHILTESLAKGIPQVLLERGADVNARTSDGTTPLHWAVISQFADLAMLTLLLDAGADVNAKNGKGRTPLHEAVAERYAPWEDVGMGADPEMVALLLDWGADVNSIDGEGKTPCQWARHHGSFSGHPILRRLCPA